jgi:catechol 2,3-dioxygenase-like lactoylglutathione lyase family enzyme
MKLTLAIWLALAFPALSQTAKSVPEPAMQASGAFFALSVSDLKASVDWYAHKFGMRIVMQQPKQGKIPAFAALEGGGLIVELLQRDDTVPLSKVAPQIKDNDYVYGITKAGVIVDDFDKTCATLKARGVEIAFGPYPKKADQRANVIVKDNAGNLIQFFGK